MSKRQREWNQFEAVILLEGFLDVLKGSITRKTAITQVSHDLREMALKQGEKIDETFRNEAGILFQMQSMESAFRGYTISKPATKLFSDTVEIYRKNNPEYKRLLEVAKAMIIDDMSSDEVDEDSLKDEFIKYLVTKVSSAQLNEFFWCLDEIEKYCLKREILEDPLFKTKDLEKLKNIKEMINYNTAFRFTHRGKNAKISSAFSYYYTFIQEKTNRENISKELTSEEETSLVRTKDDERLSKKYPVIFKRIFHVLQDSSLRGEGLTPNEIRDLTQRIARVADIEDILDNASWADFKEERYWFSNEVVFHNIVDPQNICNGKSTSPYSDDTQTEPNEQQDLIVNFENLGNLALTKPKYFTYFGEKHGPFATWKDLYVAIVSNLYDDYPYVFKQRMSFSSNKEIVDFTTKDQSIIMLSPKSISGTNYVIETFVSANDVAQKTKYLLDLCAVDYENVEITFIRNVQPDNPLQLVNGQPGIDQKLKSKTKLNDSIDADYEKNHCQNEQFKTILKEKFRQGFRMNSSIEISRFRKAYIDAYSKELQENDAEIINTICRLCIINKDRAYLSEEILSDDLMLKLLDYIDKSFNAGKTTLYYSAICDEFEEDFLDYPLHNNPELLRLYLGKVGQEKYYLNKNFISKDSNAMSDPLTEIRSCLKEFARSMKDEEIFEALPHLPQDKVKWLLRSNKEFISNGTEEYFHESIVQLSDEELENIAEIIDLTIREKDFISGNELYKAIKERYPYILDQNQGISVYGFRDALKVKFGEQYSFNGNIISRAGQQLSMSDVFGNFAKNKDNFTLTELKVFAEELGTPIYFDPVYKNSLRISQEQFVSNDQAYFSIQETDAVLDMVCTGKYISIQSVTNFGIFPDAGHPWNNFLLEEYVAEYSEKYLLLHFRFNQYECVGAIVKRSANINNFDDFTVDFLANENVELNRDSALELLAREGYIARRKYSNIEEILIRARALRNSKEVE